MESTLIQGNTNKLLNQIELCINEEPGIVAEASLKARICCVAGTALCLLGAAGFLLGTALLFSATYGISVVLLLPAAFAIATGHTLWILSKICGIVNREAKSRQHLFGAMAGGLVGATGIAPYQTKIRDQLDHSLILKAVIRAWI